MARDVAQRELDQNGFRITDLGDPQKPGDATKTDNTSVPHANAGAGSPGSSLLAAPADHVHPAADGSGGAAAISISDESQQRVLGATEELVSESFVDFSPLGTPKMTVAFSAIVQGTGDTSTFRVRIGGTPGQPDGTEVCAITTGTKQFAPDDQTTFNVVNPGHHALVKITAAGASPTDVAEIYGKTVAFRAAA